MTPKSTQIYPWLEIDSVPNTSGVYAWYFKLRIGRADIDDLVRNVNVAKASGENFKARAILKDYLDRFLFSPYRESPYKVELRGQLKPKYSGSVEHEPTQSESLIERLIEDPERCRTIAEILSEAAPGFTAPLYIGMAENLKARVKSHKRRIVELGDIGASPSTDDLPGAGFGDQVVYRGFDPTNLFVVVAEVPVLSTEHNDIENILNRINFPIFGRN